MTTTDETAGFDDLLAANERFAEGFDLAHLTAPALQHVGIITCMDSRIDPLAVFGLGIGDAKVVRNAGARVTPDAVEAMLLGVHLLGVERIMVLHHTGCAAASFSEDELRSKVAESAGSGAGWQRFHAVVDQPATLVRDVEKLRSHPLVPDHVAVGGFLYHVEDGRVTREV